MKIQRLLMSLRGGLPGQLVIDHYTLLPPRAGIMSHYLRRLNLCRHSYIYIPGRRLSSRVVIACNGIHDLIEDEWDGKNSGANPKDEFDALLVSKKYPSIIIGSSPTIELYDGTTSFSPAATQSCWGFVPDAVVANWGVPSRLCNTWSSLSLSLEEEKSSSELPVEESVASLLPNEPMPMKIGWLDKSVVEEESLDKVDAEIDSVDAAVEMILDRPIRSLPGLTKRQLHLLEKNDFHTIRKLLNHFPRTYADLQNAHIGIQDGQYLISVGRILSSRGIRAGCSFSFLEVVVGCAIVDDKPTWEHMNGDPDTKEKKTIYLHLKKFFRGTRFTSQSFLRILQEKHRVGDIVCVSGKVKSMSSEDHYEIREYNIDVLEDEDDSSLCTAGRPYPIYPSKGGLNPTFIRDVIQRALQTLSLGMDPIPKDVTQELGILCLRDAYMGIHLPKNIYEADSARKRLIFDEFFYVQLGRLFQMLEGLGTEIEKVGLLDKYRKPEMNSTYIEEWSILTQNFLKTLPYDLTTSQLSAVSEIISDLRRPVPMNRLLQGDVGCGKTVVAFLACMEVIGSGYQAAFMVPTELLAIQHHEHLLDLLGKLDSESRPSVALLTGATPSKQSRVIREGLQAGEISMVIGTHSLIAEKIEFSTLRIAVVDEQHRFGVVQRGRFNSKLYYNSVSSRNAATHLDDPSRGDANMAPHVLAMSATPIPRTLALALYGDMSLTQRLRSSLPPATTVTDMQQREANMLVVLFLRGLGSDHSALRQQVTSLDTLPSIEEVYSRAARYTPSPRISALSDSSAMVARGGHTTRGRGNWSYNSPTRGRGRGTPSRGVSGFPRGSGATSSRGSRGNRFCTHCQLPGHTVTYCYDLHPELRGLHASITEPTSSLGPLSEEGTVHLPRAEYDELIGARQRGDAYGPVATLAQHNDAKCLLSTTATPSPWVIDSGATHHMTGDQRLLTSTSSLPSTSVTLADGSTSKVVGTGSEDWSSDRWWA